MTVLWFLKSHKGRNFVHLWRPYPRQPTTPLRTEGKKKKKGGGGSQYHPCLPCCTWWIDDHSLCLWAPICPLPLCLTPGRSLEMLSPLYASWLVMVCLKVIRICMRGFPTEWCTLTTGWDMPFSWCLQNQQLKLSDNKTAVWLSWTKLNLIEKPITCLATLCILKAGSLLSLRKLEMKLSTSLTRYLQGEVFKRIRCFLCQEGGIKENSTVVCQRQFRKFLQMRDWGWSVFLSFRDQATYWYA